MLVSSTGSLAYMKGVRRGIVTRVVCVLCVCVFWAENAGTEIVNAVMQMKSV